MSHDAILISTCAGAMLVVYLIGWAFGKARAAIRAVVLRWDEGIKLAHQLRADYAEIKAGQNKDTNDLRLAVIAMTAAIEKFGLPLEAVPNILKSQVGGLMVLKDTIESFSKTIIGNAQGNHIEPDERRESGEDEIIRLQESGRLKGQDISREEAMERVQERKLWNRMNTLIPTGSDD